jgi:glycyl-tRNA synthetase beta chain
LTGSEGKLAPNFVCTANIEAADGGAAIVAGNQKVLAARLSDAKFFWEQDLKIPLEDQAKKLEQIVFHEKLGTVADKVERVAKLARWLVEQGIVRSGVPAEAGAQSGAEAGLLLSQEHNGAELADRAETAARLAKADLVTGMVGEFPELQGIIGGYLARAQGRPDAVADAVRDHYKPAGQGDEVPTAPITVAVSIADKIDSIVGFFSIDERPTGSRDPFGLRRSALGIIELVTRSQLRFGMDDLVARAVGGYTAQHIREGDVDSHLLTTLGQEFFGSVQAFFADRLKVQQREADVRHDLIDAVFTLGGEDDLVRLLARVRALQSFVETPEGADLLAGYKRAANILKKEGWGGASRAMADQENESIPQTGEEDPLVLVDDPLLADAVAEFARPNKGLSYEPLPEEAALIAALDEAEPKAEAAIEAEDFEGAMAALASLRAPVDSFFDKVTVNDPDHARREARLDLLARMRDAVHRVADFSKIEG